MLLADSEGKARCRRVQPTVTTGVPVAWRPRLAGCGRPRWLAGLAPTALLFALAGCSDVPNRANPVTWWHDLEGGEIAKNRPPPPNPNAPFPKIASAPARPAGMPDWEWTQLSATLAAQRASAQQYAAQNPIPTLPGAPATTTTAKRATAPAPAPAPVQTQSQAGSGSGTASAQSAATATEIARLAAAPGPAGSQPATLPTGVVATATANAGNSTNSALTFNGPSARPTTTGPRSVPISAAASGQPAPTPGSPNPGGPNAGTRISYFDPNNGLSIPGALGPVTQPDEAHPPPVPMTVPVPPAVPGFAISTIPSTYIPPVEVAQPALYVPPPPLPDVPPVRVKFAPHSAVLTPPMQRALLQLVQASQGAHIGVTGFGDAASTAIIDQAAVMPLALERARAMQVQLIVDGVPRAGVSIDARALGSGGLARLVD
jgi:hypothetical protein